MCVGTTEFCLNSNFVYFFSFFFFECLFSNSLETVEEQLTSVIATEPIQAQCTKLTAIIGHPFIWLWMCGRFICSMMIKGLRTKSNISSKVSFQSAVSNPETSQKIYKAVIYESVPEYLFLSLLSGPSLPFQLLISSDPHHTQKIC